MSEINNFNNLILANSSKLLSNKQYTPSLNFIIKNRYSLKNQFYPSKTTKKLFLQHNTASTQKRVEATNSNTHNTASTQKRVEATNSLRK